jgi:hypothetical protein
MRLEEKELAHMRQKFKKRAAEFKLNTPQI